MTIDSSSSSYSFNNGKDKLLNKIDYDKDNY